MILALLATLGTVVVAFVLYPVFASKAPEPIGLDKTQSELRDLGERRTQILSNIKDLEFEKASGKLSDADYETSRNDYMAQVSAVITRMDELASPQDKERKKKVSAAPKKTAPASKAETIACASCGEANPKGSKFCLDCGSPFEARCGACGETLPNKAKFCSACGEKVNT